VTRLDAFRQTPFEPAEAQDLQRPLNECMYIRYRTRLENADQMSNSIRKVVLQIIGQRRNFGTHLSFDIKRDLLTPSNRIELMNQSASKVIIGRLCAIIGVFGIVFATSIARGGERMIEDFSGSPASRWDFISDQVMGGVSTGRVSLEAERGQTILHLQGNVSTKNNGGFIQARLKLSERLPKDARGLELKVKGNGQTYYVHARTGGTILPWNFYQASFDTTSDWVILRIPFDSFMPQGRMIRKTLVADAIRSLAVVAFGRDYTADVSVASIGTY